MSHGDSETDADPDATADAFEPTADGFDPAAAFALLGDETRLRILRALWEAQRESDGRRADGVPFEALRERAAVSDSGRFNYHLGKLTDRFVERTDTGYRLRFAGNRVVGALLEGTYAPGEALELAVDGACWRCGGSLVLRYADERVHVTCEECGVDTTDFGCPPGVLAGRDTEDIPGVVDAHLRTLLTRARRGICPTCSGPTTTTVAASDDDDVDDHEAPLATLRCDRCGDRVRAGLPTLVFDRPVVVSFLHERGVDPEAAPLWVVLDDIDHDVAIEDASGHASVVFTVGDDTLTVTVDSSGEVVGVEEAEAAERSQS